MNMRTTIYCALESAKKPCWARQLRYEPRLVEETHSVGAASLARVSSVLYALASPASQAQFAVMATPQTLSANPIKKGRGDSGA